MCGITQFVRERADLVRVAMSTTAREFRQALRCLGREAEFGFCRVDAGPQALGGGGPIGGEVEIAWGARGFFP